jgi:light-regulated signal transduction histidine kinase (bacteriophytochrome)
MKALINDLLDYSRVGTHGVAFAQVDMNRVLDTVKRNLKVLLEDKQVVLTCQPLPTLLGDQGQLVQLVQNLVNNAVKFNTKEQVKVDIGVAASGPNWIVAVHDNGIGIEKQYLERIFVMFKRLHRADEFPGTGIGLALCKKIVERHRGRIWVESNEGEGSVFYFSMPMAIKGMQV